MKKCKQITERNHLKIFRKAFLFMMCSSALQFQVAASSVETISLNIKNGKITDVFKAIEKQSGYKFFYNNRQVDLQSRININISEENIETVLDDLFAETAITYKIINNQVVLTNATSAAVKETKPASQTKPVTGKVTDASGDPLIGVNVLVQGSTIGGITDIDGNYYLADVPENAVLIFSYIGYNTLNKALKGRNVVNVMLIDDTHKLDVVVVVGYGSFKNSDYTGSIT